MHPNPIDIETTVCRTPAELEALEIPAPFAIGEAVKFRDESGVFHVVSLQYVNHKATCCADCAKPYWRVYAARKGKQTFESVEGAERFFCKA